MTEVYNNNHELPQAPSNESIKKLKETDFIRNGSPFWWSTDYAPDPRENIPFDEFQNRLVHIGNAEVVRRTNLLNLDSSIKDVHLYPNPKVPISVINLPIDGMTLPFMVTARPFHEKEAKYSPSSQLLLNGETIETLKSKVLDHEPIELLEHFYPHIRGLFAGKRGNHFFWYPVRPYPDAKSFEDYQNPGFVKIRDGLNKAGINNLDIYRYSYEETPTYPGVWDEIFKCPDLLDVKGGPRWLDFDEKEVSAPEFLEQHEKVPNLLLYYPFRNREFVHTLPLAITNTTNKGSTNSRPAVLGVFADNGLIGRPRRRGIFRIRDRELALSMAASISSDFGIPVDTVVFTPQQGKPKYERVGY